MEHNEDNHLKPTPNVNYFPKFLWEEKSLLISLAAFELLKFEKWPQVVLRNHNFGKESSPVLLYVLYVQSNDYDKSHDRKLTVNETQRLNTI